MDVFIRSALKFLIELLGNPDGAQGVVFVLLFVVAGLVWHIVRLGKTIERKDERIEKIIDDYHKGNTTLAEAFNQLRLVLVEIRAKL